MSDIDPGKTSNSSLPYCIGKGVTEDRVCMLFWKESQWDFIFLLFIRVLLAHGCVMLLKETICNVYKKRKKKRKKKQSTHTQKITPSHKKQQQQQNQKPKPST